MAIPKRKRPFLQQPLNLTYIFFEITAVLQHSDQELPRFAPGGVRL